MTILLSYLFTGWFLVSLTINLTRVRKADPGPRSGSPGANFIFNKLLKTISNKLMILLILINGFFWIILFSTIPYDLLNESMNVYCTDGTEKESNPYMVTISSEHYNKSFSFDLRYLKDVGALGIIGKTSVFVAKYMPASVKAVSTIGTATALGSTYLGIRIIEYVENQKRIFTITKEDKGANLIIEPNSELGGTVKDVEEIAKNIKINSPYEASEILEVQPGASTPKGSRPRKDLGPGGAEGIKIILFCTEILSTLAIIGFILYSLFILIKYVDLNKFNINNNFVLKFINYVQKLSIVYILFWGVFSLFNLSVILYLTIRLSNFLDSLTV